MKTAPIGVRELLERVAERVRYGRTMEERFADSGEGYRYVQDRLRGVIEAALDLVRNRDVQAARRLVETLDNPAAWPIDSASLGLARGEFLPACRLIEQIDHFLRALPSEAPRGFVPEFYGDVATLGIVADWCEDHGYSHSATEARHFLTQLRQWM